MPLASIPPQFLRVCWIVLTAAVYILGDTANASIDNHAIILVKIGGSSITQKAKRESLDQDALDWFARSIHQSVNSAFLAPVDSEKCSAADDRELAFVIVHGAGSFGHFSAKDYLLKGQSDKPSNATLSTSRNRFRKRGIAETRLSVQTLNRLVVQSLLQHQVNAVGISPCFGIPGLEAHAGKQTQSQLLLQKLVKDTIEAGLVPVLHGDACLYGNDGGILSGDTIMEILGTSPWVHHSVFITDVDGVFTEDPRTHPNATLLRHIFVDQNTGGITTQLSASSSTHDHDVTGGLAVSLQRPTYKRQHHTLFFVLLQNISLIFRRSFKLPLRLQRLERM